MHELFFYLFALISIAGALGVVIFRQPIHSAVALLATLVAIAGLFLLQGAEFLAATQILLYVGGILTIFLFAIMFVSVKEAFLKKRWNVQWPISILIGAMFCTAIITFTGYKVFSGEPKGFSEINNQFGGNIAGISEVLFRTYIIPFEVISLFLIVAMVGAILLGSWGVKK